MENIEKSPNVPPFVRYCAMLIPTVFDDSLSYYEALCALSNWVQKNLVEVVNHNAEVTEEYIQLTNDLKAYVENYFENLDVQEEINNKLDAMVEAGTLQEIVASYLQANVAWTFDTVAEMKAGENFVNGSFAQTLGYYAKNDGGKALFKIRTISNDDTVDETFIYQITNSDNLVAELIIDDSMNVKQFGVKSDGTTDNYNKLYTLLNKGVKKLYFPNGEYLINTSLTINNCMTVIGESMSGTIIKAPDGFVTWSTNKNQRLISNLTIDGVSIDNNTGINGVLAFSKLSSIAIKNYETAIRTVTGTWINSFYDIMVTYCTNGYVQEDVNFNNNTFYNCYFQNITNKALNLTGSGIKFVGCNFENCGISAYIMGRNVEFDTCYFENNTNNYYIDKASYNNSILFRNCWLYAGVNPTTGWIASLFAPPSVDASSATFMLEGCQIDNITKDTVKPITFNGTGTKSYWGVSVKNNRYQNIKTTNPYNIFYDDLIDSSVCTQYARPGNFITFESDLPLFAENGIIWFQIPQGNMAGSSNTNRHIRMLGKYEASNTTGSITITPSKKYGCVYPTINNLPVTVRFTDGTYDIATMNITLSDFTITSIPYNSRTVAEVIFNNDYGTNIR